MSTIEIIVQGMGSIVVYGHMCVQPVTDVWKMYVQMIVYGMVHCESWGSQIREWDVCVSEQLHICIICNVIEHVVQLQLVAG
jgi:hypothetical protein